MLIVNSRSRRGRDWQAQAAQTLTDLGIHLDEVAKCRSIEDIVSSTTRAIGQKEPLVIVGGGDGTFSTVARYFVGSDSVLGVLPLGTGNQFARDLGIPAQVQTACEIIANARTTTVDLGIVADDYFLNVATIGLTTTIARSLTVDAKRRLGRFVYAFALLKALRVSKPFHVTISSENGETEFDTLQLVLGNGRYHAGPLLIAPNASITEGKLSLYALRTTNRAAFLKLALYLPSGRHVDLPEVHYEDTTGGMISATPARSVTVDGEICATTPIRYGIAPDSIRVVVPDTFLDR